jgi:hypothetical protein
MSSSSRTSGTLPETALPTHCQPGRRAVGAHRQQEMRLDDIAAKEQAKRDAIRAANATEAQERLAPIFKAAVDRWGKAEAYALAIGTDKGTLSKMLSGERLIGPRDWIPLMDSPEAWAVWVGGVAAVGGLAASVRRRPAISAATIRERIADLVIEDARRGGIMGNAILDRVAELEHVERGEVDTTIEQEDDVADEPTYHAEAVLPCP